MAATDRRKPTAEEIQSLRARIAGLSHEEAARIPLHRRDGSVAAYALIDAADLYWAQFNWYLTGPSRKPYVTRTLPQIGGRRQPQQKLHRVLMGCIPGDGLEVDHINGDQLDCRRSNLRVVAKGKNQQNRPPVQGSTSKYRGVSWSRVTNKWRARVTVNGHVYQLGDYHDEDEAGRIASEFRSAMMTHTNEARCVCS